MNRTIPVYLLGLLNIDRVRTLCFWCCHEHDQYSMCILCLLCDHFVSNIGHKTLLMTASMHGLYASLTKQELS